MRERHIRKLIEAGSIGRLSETEIEAVESHIKDCIDCSRAYRSAQVTDILLRARAAAEVEASPFFHTRVMAALGERELSPEVSALVRMWKAAGALVSAMAAVVVVLIGLTIFGGNANSELQQSDLTASQNIYSPEYLVFDDVEAADESLPYDQVFATVYDSEEADGQ